MGLVNSNIRLRDSKANTAAALAETFNTLHGLIVASGMTQVSSTDVTGQAGRFVTTAPQAGETQVLHDLSTGTTGARLIGYKVYKHPVLQLYIKVNFIDYAVTVSATASSQIGYAKITYQLATKLLNGALDASTSSPVLTPMSADFATGQGDVTYFVADYKPINVFCNDKSFWIGKISSVVYTRDANGYANLVNGVNEVGIGVLSSTTDALKLCVILPQSIKTISSTVYGDDIIVSNSPMGVRYFVFNNNTFETRQPCSAGHLIDVGNISNANGVRVAKSKLIIGGIEHYFDFGFVNASIVNDSQAVNVNITGTQKNYMALHNFGCANPSYPKLALNNMSIIVMPME